MRLLFALLLALVPLSAFGANPTLTSFENPDFTVDTNSPPASPTNVIRVNLRSGQFSHDANGITLTNVGSSIGTGVPDHFPYWLTTNTFGTSPLSYDGFSLVVSNATSYHGKSIVIWPSTGVVDLYGYGTAGNPGKFSSFDYQLNESTLYPGHLFFGGGASGTVQSFTFGANDPTNFWNFRWNNMPQTNSPLTVWSNAVQMATGVPLYVGTNWINASSGSPTWNGAAWPGALGGNVINTGPSVVNMVPVYTDTSGTQVTPTNSISVSTLNVGTINYTNPPVLPSYTVANLPVSSAGAMAWATDILTPIQSDKTVYYDGSNWRLTRSAIKATADLPTFLRNCLEVGWEGKTPSNWGMMMDFFPINMAGYLDARFYAGNSGTGSGITSLSYYTPEDPCGSGLSAGTTTTGFCYMKGGNIYPIAGFGTILSAHIALNSGLPDGTDNYWVYIGFDTTAAGGVLGANSSGVYYDPYNALGYGATLTNNWQFVNRSNSVGTIVDTGHTADANWTDFTNVRTGTSNIVYINGTAVLTNLTYTQTAYQAPVLQITKTLGTNARYFAVDWVYWAYHFNTARSFR